MAPSMDDIAAAEAALRAHTRKTPRIDPNHAHRPPIAPPVFDLSKDEADAVIAKILAELQD